MFKAIFINEFTGLICKRNIIIIISVFLMLSIFCLDGINDFTVIKGNIKPFQDAEIDKVSRHIHYTFFGIRGVRILYVPDQISVIFNDSTVFDNMTAHIDTAEKLRISNSFKSTDLFSDSGGYMDFSGIILIIVSFLGLVYGHDGTRKHEYLKMIADLSGQRNPSLLITISRTILLNLVFWILTGSSLILILLFGINIANVYFLVFILILTLVTTFFVFTGAFIGTWRKKSAQWIALPVVYFLLVLLLPWMVQKVIYMEAKNGLQSIYDFDYEMLEIMLKLEQRSFDRIGTWKSGSVAPDNVKAMVSSGQELEYKKLRKMEEKRINDILKRIQTYQTIASFFPTTLYQSFNKEISSKGFHNFIDFYRYAYQMKYRFIQFYIERKFYHPLPESGVEPFVTGNENLYYGKSQFPPTLLPGIGMTLLYICCLFFLLHRIKKNEPGTEAKEPLIVFDTNRTAMIALCKSDRVKTDIFRYYQCRDTAACLDQYPADFYRNGRTAQSMLRYFSRLTGINIDVPKKYLAQLGLENLNRCPLTSEDVLKIYTAVKVSGHPITHLVLNDFFKMKTRQFENDFRNLGPHLIEQGIKIIYLSCEMPYPKKPLHERINVKQFETYPLDFQNVTLR